MTTRFATSPRSVGQFGSSYPLRRLGRSAEARQRLDAAFERLGQLKLYPAEKVTPGSVAYKALRARADLGAASDIYQKLAGEMRAASLDWKNNLADAVDLSNVYQPMAGLYRRTGRADQAATIESQRLELWRHWGRALPQNAFVLRQIAASDRGAAVEKLASKH